MSQAHPSHVPFNQTGHVKRSPLARFARLLAAPLRRIRRRGHELETDTHHREQGWYGEE